MTFFQKRKNIALLIALLAIVSFLWWSFFWTVEADCPPGGYFDIDAGTCVYDTPSTLSPALEAVQ